MVCFLRHRPFDTFLRCQQGLLLFGCVLDHRDDVDQRFVITRRVRPLQLLFCEAVV